MHGAPREVVNQLRQGSVVEPLDIGPACWRSRTFGREQTNGPGSVAPKLFEEAEVIALAYAELASEERAWLPLWQEAPEECSYLFRAEVAAYRQHLRQRRIAASKPL